MKKFSLSILIVLALATGVASVYAEDMVTPTPAVPTIPLPSFNDGRLNAYDPAAPVIVFNTYKEVPIVNDNGVPTTAKVVDGIQLLRWNGEVGSVTEVLNVSADEINAAIEESDTGTETFPILKQNGYTLNYAKSGYMWISTPADFEGKVYTFSWPKDF